MRSPVGADLRAGLGAEFGGATLGRARAALDVERPSGSRATTGAARRSTCRLRGSGLPARTMGRTLDEDPLFFAAALAGGGALA